MRMHVPILSTIEKATQDELRKAGRQILQRSNQLAPKDDGDLVKTGRAIVDDLTLQVSYTAPHAHLQHENLEYQHEDGGQAKFLETAIDELAGPINAALAAAVRKSLGG